MNWIGTSHEHTPDAFKIIQYFLVIISLVHAGRAHTQSILTWDGLVVLEGPIRPEYQNSQDHDRLLIVPTVKYPTVSFCFSSPILYRPTIRDSFSENSGRKI